MTRLTPSASFAKSKLTHLILLLFFSTQVVGPEWRVLETTQCCLQVYNTFDVADLNELILFVRPELWRHRVNQLDQSEPYGLGDSRDLVSRTKL